MKNQLLRNSNSILRYAVNRKFSPSSVVSKPNHSGLQKQVIELYRKLLRTSYGKDASIPFVICLTDESTSTFAVRQKFRRQSEEISKRDHARIEHHIRQGEKYIKIMNMGSVKGFSLPGN